MATTLLQTTVPPLAFNLFGPFEVRLHGRPLPRLRTRKGYELLALLLLRQGSAVDRTWLADTLWPESTEEQALANLRNTLKDLRHALGSEAERLHSPTPRTLALDQSAVGADVTAFDAAMVRSDPASLAEAVTLYRGPLLEGWAEEWALQERQVREQAYLGALERLAANARERGQLTEAEYHLRRAVAVDPMWETGQRALMEVLVAGGNYAGAVQIYGELRRLLLRELNAEPSPETTALFQEFRAAVRRMASGTGRKVPRPAPGPGVSIGAPAAVANPHSLPGTENPAEPGTSARRLPGAGESGQDRSRESSFAAGPAPARVGSGTTVKRVALLHQPGAQPDEQLLRFLETQLAARGYQVSTDRPLAVGAPWAREVGRQVREADAVLPLLSAPSIASELLTAEVQMAREAATEQNGRPRLLPIRVGLLPPLPVPLGAILDSLPSASWESAADDARLLGQLLEALRHPAEPGPASRPARLEPVGGAVPLDSPFYIVRPADVEFRSAIEYGDSIVLVKGARQMGKTSLLGRGLQEARATGSRVVLTDLQILNATHLESAETFFFALAEWLADLLDLEISVEEEWQSRRGASINFQRFMRRAVLDRIEGPLVWGLDEVDRLFTCDFGSEVLGLFRSWHNQRVTEPTAPWSRLTLALAYATEAHLFITDLNQSPFNVGTRLMLTDLTPEQVAELNQRYGEPLRNEAEVARYYRLIRGQPYLVRRGLHEMVKGISLERLEAQADREEGLFGDHLRRMLLSLVRDAELCEALRAVLRGQPCPTDEAFFRLRTAGLLSGETLDQARPRCELYATYLARHLL